jgi:hypothetical protein
MKIQNVIRMQIVAVAIGAAMLSAGASRAQEIDNPSFDQGPNSVPFSQKAHASASSALPSNAAASNAPAPHPVLASTPATTTARPLAEEAAVISLPASVESGAVATMAISAGLFILLLRMETKRRRATLRRRHTA